MIAPWVCKGSQPLGGDGNQRGVLSESKEYTQKLPPIHATFERRGLLTVEGPARAVEGLNAQFQPT